MAICNICGKIYTSQSHLNRHSRNVHNIHPKPAGFDKNVHSYKCLEEGCNNSFRYSLDLISHLKTDHLFNIEEPEVIKFARIEDFKAWKIEIEKLDKCNYIIKRGAQRLASGDQKTYYVCNRSGGYEKTAIKRATKSQGTCKLNRACISQMNIIKSCDGSISVERQKMHYGHSMEIQHLRISKDDRNTIANKLLQGASKTRILDCFRTKIGSDLKRSDLIVAKDIDNVERDFKLALEKGIKHKEDAVSIDIWASENMQGDDNQVLYYKSQGQMKDPLESSDFCLIIMNNYQLLMLQTFGHNIIAVDSTHGLNQYDFEMTTMMVIDDYGEGFPVVYMFSNRKDTFVHILLFNIIKEKCGTIKAKTFMSDMSEVFYKAWISVMGKTEHQLYCSWHVDRAWRTNLGKITDKEKRSWVYKMLKALQHSIDETSFLDKLQNMIANLQADQATNKFGNYFKENYSENYKKWAYCYRKSCGINTNMVLESMHKCIKYFYLKRKMVKRLDKGLYAVLQYTRDKMVDRIIKQTKGKSTSRIKDIMKRHQIASSKSSDFEAIDNGHSRWELKCDQNTYYIEKMSSEMCCQVQCNLCNICIHMFSCSCPDFYIQSTICKHIHFLCIHYDNRIDDKNLPITEKVDSNIQMCLSQLSSGASKNTGNLHEKLCDELSAFNVKIAKADVDSLNSGVLSKMLTHVRALNSLVDMKQIESTFIPKVAVSTNQNISKQLSFHSTKKKRANNSKDSKPNVTETDIINKLLSGKKIEFISNNSDHDHKYI